MNREILFPTPIYFKMVKDVQKMNKYLYPLIKAWSKKDKSETRTNAGGGWHSPTDMNKKTEYNPLTQEVFDMQHEIYKDYGMQPKPGLGNMWANINYPGGYNRPHLHPNSLFSGVYWIKTPIKSGDLILYDPRPGIHTTMPNRKEGKLPPQLWREVHYRPRAGTVVMFPAWLWHEVRTNESNDIRISVSFNFLQR